MGRTEINNLPLCFVPTFLDSYWGIMKPNAFREVLSSLWSKPCPNLQNWNETFLGLGLLVEEKFQSSKIQLFHAVWATIPATPLLSKLLGIPFSRGTCL